MSPGTTTEESEEISAARLDRELIELLQELRVAQGGILILVGFLLVIPFTTRFPDVTEFQKVIYYLSFLSAGAAAVMIIAPVSYHRLVFRRRDKRALVERGNLMVMAGLALLALAILGVLVLVTDFIFSGWLAAGISVVYVALVGFFWYALPLHSRRQALGSSR